MAKRKTIATRNTTPDAVPPTDREDFPAKVVREIGKRAMYICAGPECFRLTGYGTSEGKARSIAEGAHIVAAGKKGPRANAKLSPDYVTSADNGI
jgi:hypothetical protein